MSKAEEVDEEHLELVEMRLDIDVDKLRAYLVANSDFPDGAVEIKQFNKASRIRLICSQRPTATATSRCDTPFALKANGVSQRALKPTSLVRLTRSM